MLLAEAGYYSGTNVRALAEPERLIASHIDHHRRAADPALCGRIPTTPSSRERMRHKLTTECGRRRHEQRGRMIEPVFGDTMGNRGV